LQTRASAIRSIDAKDDDFKDLGSFAHAIGNARLVMLGEPSHGAGSAFKAKARLVKFLHQQLGFDALIWESGLYDVALAQAAMRGAEAPIDAARKGVFGLWTEAVEVKPVFDYVRATQATLRPLEMAGFDMQVSAGPAVQQYGPDLRGFVAELQASELREEALGLATSATEARVRLFRGGFSDAADKELLDSAARGLRNLIGSHRDAFEGRWGRAHTDFFDNTIENMRIDALQRSEAAQTPETTPERENRRDARNAAVLRWLVEERFAGRRVMVWAHNVHIMKAHYSGDFRRVHLDPEPNDMKPTGAFVRDWFGNEAYALGVTAFVGDDGMATGGASTQIAPAPTGSLEAGLHELGYPYAFVDFRGAPQALRAPIVARMPKYDSVEIGDPGQVFDGILFIDEMAPATKVQTTSGSL
jgi:erythromycin esterase